MLLSLKGAIRMQGIFYPVPPQEAEGEILEILRAHRTEAERREAQVLYQGAARSSDHRRPDGAEQDHRLPYKRDVDRIVHSKAYARYIDKTQVVYLVDADHVTRRLIHVQLVSSFARGIAEILRLNCDLVEAIALGHDVGHPPFGHEGETYLCKLAKEMGAGPFAHPAQSCRLFREIEPLNLGLAVYDGFLCHDGGMAGRSYTPNFGKNWADHERELKQKMRNPDRNIWPGTLEGCLVKLCDTASYIGRDIEDAVRLGILDREEVPKTLLGTHNRDILRVIAADIIRQSYEKDEIALSEEVFEALKEIRAFNFERIYLHPKLKVESERVERGYRIMCETLLNDIHKNGETSHLWRNFLHNKRESYLTKTGVAQMVVDYISGMTDSYFVRTLEELVLPQRIHLD
jgi:dGTPase